MAKREFTAEQLEAIQERGGQILVAAAAGSGKTSVLVERLYEQLLGAKVQDLSQFLIITFTNDAAGELKERIGKRLKSAIAALQEGEGNQENLRLIGHLQKQVSLLPHANVSTIHGFCGKLLREHGHLMGMNPGFAQMTEEDGEIMAKEVIDLTLQRWYGKNRPDFLAMVDYFSGDRTDIDVETMILSLYAQIQSEANPLEWLKYQGRFWDVSGVTGNRLSAHGFLLHLPWVQGGLAYMLSELTQALEDMADFVATYPQFSDQVERGKGSMADYGEMIDLLEQALAIGQPVADGTSGESTEEDITNLFHIPAKSGKSVLDWDYLVDGLELPMRVGPKKMSKAEKDANKIRLALDNRVRHLHIWKSCDEMMEDISALAPHMAVLIEVVESFEEAYRKEKDRRNLLDFADLEHFAVKLLVDDQGNRTELAKSVSGQFVEVMVDEYQDTNQVQNRIFSAVARQDGAGQEQNLFFVGDVKQSIYSFRLADPSIFARHFKEFSKTKGIYPRAILLRRNFRSRHAVIDACNDFFRMVMTEKFGQTDYEKDGMLQQAGTFPVLEGAEDEEPTYHLDLDLLDVSSYDMEHLSGGAGHLEAKWIAKRVRDLVDSHYQVKLDDTSTRDVTYGDILILIRSPKGLTDYYEQAMAEYGVPFLSPGGEDIFTSTEVSVALSFLKVIDNPLQDVPLVSVLRSPLFGFTNDELVLLRQGEGRYFYHSLLAVESVPCWEKESPEDEFCTHDSCNAIRCQVLPSLLEKRSGFLKMLKEFRQASWEMDGESLLWYVMERSNMLGIFGAMIDGETRQARLLEFHRIIGQFGQESVFSTLKKLDDLAKVKSLPTVKLGHSPEDVVELKTVHMAKGLEKPVVIVAGLSKHYNMDSMYAPLLVDSRFGLGPRLYQEGLRYFQPMLSGEVLKKVKYGNMVSEELRLMYVAMTRAQEKLILTLPLEDGLETFETVAEELSVPLQASYLESRKSMGEILLSYAMLREDGGKLWDLADLDISDYLDEDDLEELRDRELSHWDIQVVDCGKELGDVADSQESEMSPESETSQAFESSGASGEFESSGASHTSETGETTEEGDGFDDLGHEASWWQGLEELCRQRYAYDFHRKESEIPSKFTATQLKGRTVVSSVQEDATLEQVLEEPFYAYLEEETYGDVMSEYLSALEEGTSFGEGNYSLEDAYNDTQNARDSSDFIATMAEMSQPSPECQEHQEYPESQDSYETWEDASRWVTEISNGDSTGISYDTSPPLFPNPVTGGRTSGEMYPPELSLEERRKRERHPQFLQEEEKVLTPSQRGDAIHMVMQYLSLSSLATIPEETLAEEIRSRLHELVEAGKITVLQRSVIDEHQIMCFLQSHWGREAMAASVCSQEFKFSMLVSGTRLGYDTEEPLLLQGVVDCWYESAPDEIVVIDFKSGRVPMQIPNILQKKAQEHETQMAVYAMALDEITGKKVVRKVLWFFEANCGVEVFGDSIEPVEGSA